MLLARLSTPDINGTGELWIDRSGLPARLVLNLGWIDQEQTPHRVRVASTADYFGFGRRFPPEQFDPTASPETGAPILTTYCVLRNALCLSKFPTQYAVRNTITLLALLAFLAVCWLLIRARRGSRRATVILTAILIMALLAPTFVSVAEAAGVRERLGGDQGRSETPPAPGSEVARMLEETRSLANRYLANSPNPAMALDDMGDEDGDGLPNGYELRLGTNPFSKDTDRDGLTDYDEVNGTPCQWYDQVLEIETDPLNPDSNYDGLRDGDEYWRGQCADPNGHRYAWYDDNDNDGVPDGIDLSPFSTSRQVVELGGRDTAGANLTFESLDQDPSATRTIIYPFYVEIQVRPKNTDSLRWAYKSLEWPAPDHESAIRHDPAGGALAALFTGKDHISSGEIKLVPFLQATLRESDLPSNAAMAQYGVSVSPHKDGEGNPVYENGEALYDMAVPLIPIERGGQVFAFQTKMLHDRGRRGSTGLTLNSNLSRHWRDLRLKWAIIGDVLMPDNDGDYVASPDGGYGLAVYDEPYQITGLQVSRQGGASMLVAGAIPARTGRSVPLDARIALLRAGLEAQFLTGRLNLADIKARFNTPNSATNDERWGIPQTWEYRVKHDVSMNYSHLDAAIATTAMTTTRQVLNELYVEHTGLEPTLILASEQRTSTVNLDDDPTTNYLDITINTCLKPLITSRSLKLQTYRWDPTASSVGALAGSTLNVQRSTSNGLGDWVPLSLDEVLQALEDQFANFLSEEELNILKMATTAWQTGMTAIQKIGELDIQDVANALSDPEMVLEFLDENGLLPSQYKDVVEVVLDVIKAGGPEAWLEKQWNKVMGVVDTLGDVLDGSFFDFSGEFSLPSEETLLSWTNTAISVLNFLAMVTGDSVFTEVAKILTKIIEIYQKIRALWDSIKASIDALKNGVEAAVQTLAKELGALSRPLSLAGLIIAIGAIWVGLGLTLQFGDFGPSVTLALVVKAIVETIILVVLFVVATFFPYGTIVAVAIGLILFIQDLIGFKFEPVSALLDWLFTPEVKQRTTVLGDPQFGNLDMEPLEPGGGIFSGRKFRLKLSGILTMVNDDPETSEIDGDAGDLNQSWAELHLGRFVAAKNVPVSLCTPSQELFNAYKDHLGASVSQEFSALNYYCVAFTLPRSKYWLLTASGAYLGGSVYQSSPGIYRRDFLSTAYLDVESTAAVNGYITLDVSYDLWTRYDQCAPATGCDEYISKSTTAPAIELLYFDILPGSLKGLWEWYKYWEVGLQVLNRDPDGDGIEGYLLPNIYGEKHPVGPDANLCPGMASWERWDTDYDGLSDKFELETPGFDPCKKDTDGDGLEDGRELLIGTSPNDPDTDNDELTDKDEMAYHGSVELIAPWRVKLSDLYPTLPDPAAFPNPRQPNLDNDHRNDKKEKAKESSPNAFNPIPVGEALDLRITQKLTSGGGTDITVRTPSWLNDEASAISPTLTITLPVAFSNLTLNAGLLPPVSWQAFNHGVQQPSGTPNVYQWTLPPIWLNRHLKATLAGLPDILTEPMTITAELAYTEGGVPQVSTAAAPLKVNMGGPTTSFGSVAGAVLLSGPHPPNPPLPIPGEGGTGLPSPASPPKLGGTEGGKEGAR